MDTKDLINLKKQRIEEEIQKIIPPGFSWSAYPTEKERQKYSPNRSVAEENWREFLGQDLDLIMQVGYIKPTNPEYAKAIGNLRYFGGKLSNYKDFINSGPFFKDPEGSKNFEEACDYIIRFYDLTKIIVRRVEEEQKVSIRRKDLKEKKENQSSEKQKKATKFVSGATKFRPGKRITIKSTKVSGLIPKRTAPQEVLDRISKPQESTVEDSIDAPKKVVSVFGKLTLDLVQINDNLDKIREVIVEDYKKTKERRINETKEYRKRVSDRSKKIGKKDLGDSKKDLKGIVKKYAGSFFSGAGGAIRALALFNMAEALMSGNPMKALGPLLGIGATYLPVIAQTIGGIIAAKVIGGLFKGGRVAPRGRVPRGGRVPSFRLGKFGKLAALGTGALALGAAFLNRDQKDEESSKIEQRLESLKEEQKESVLPEDLVPIPQEDLKKFEDLNKKFEKALEFLMKTIKDNEITDKAKISSSGTSSSGSSSSGGGSKISQELLDSDMNPNMAGYLTRLSYLETRIRNVPNQQGSGAEGFFQAMGPFTQEAIQASGGLSPRSPDFTTAAKSTMSWIYVNNKPAYDAILQGNYDRADELLKGTWPSLPGGSQAQSADVQRKSREYLRGGRSFSTQPPVELPDLNSRIRESRQIPIPISPSVRQYPNIETSPPSSTPIITPIPIQKKSESSPMSMSDQGNVVINHVSTTYSDNLFTLYSRLIYQIV